MSRPAYSALDLFLAEIVANNNFQRFDIGFHPATEQLPARFIASCWGDGIGNHNHCSMNGAVARDAIENCLAEAGRRRAAGMREPEVEASHA